MGRDDEAAVEAALASGAGYVGLVASAKRAGAVTAELRERGVDEEALARIRSPAGLDLGPSAQEEVAVAAAKETAVRDGITYYFCGPHCRKRFEAARV